MNEITKTGSTALGAVGQPRMGFEEPVDQRDLIIPVVKMFQGNATEAEQYPDAKGGQLLNSLTQEVLAGEFVPCFKWTEWAKFNARETDDPLFDPAFEAGALIWKTTTPTPEQIAECEFKADGSKPTAVRSMCFLVYMIGQQMPLVLRFSKTSFTAGKKLLSLAQFSGGSMFDRKYKLTTKKEQKDKNIYYVMQVAQISKSSEDEVGIAKAWYNDFKGKALKVHEDDVVTGSSQDFKD